MDNLTLEQRKLYEFIFDYKTRYNGNSPSYREMQAHMGFTNNGQIDTVLNGLQRRGMIVKIPGVARGISIPNTGWGYVQEVTHDPVLA